LFVTKYSDKAWGRYFFYETIFSAAFGYGMFKNHSTSSNVVGFLRNTSQNLAVKFFKNNKQGDGFHALLPANDAFTTRAINLVL